MDNIIRRLDVIIIGRWATRGPLNSYTKRTAPSVVGFYDMRVVRYVVTTATVFALPDMIPSFC